MTSVSSPFHLHLSYSPTRCTALVDWQLKPSQYQAQNYDLCNSLRIQVLQMHIIWFPRKYALNSRRVTDELQVLEYLTLIGGYGALTKYFWLAKWMILLQTFHLNL